MANYKQNVDMQKLKHLGEGGFGSVYLIEHPELGKIAYKQLRTSNNDEKSIRQFNKEAEIQTRLRHPNITALYYAEFDVGNFGFYLEYMKYGSVDRFIDEFEVSKHWRVQFVYDVSLGMSYLHKQSPVIVHGDLKCENILIGDGFHAKISDFGLARIQQNQTQSKDCAVKGTLAYIPPEYLHDPQKKKTEGFDVYGFAIATWEIFKGKRAYHDFCDTGVIPVSVLRGDRPKFEDTDFINIHIRDLIVKCWHPQPDQRPTFEHVRDVVKKELSSIETELQQSLPRLKESGATEQILPEPAISAYGIVVNEEPGLNQQSLPSLKEQDSEEQVSPEAVPGITPSENNTYRTDSGEPTGKKGPTWFCFAVVVISLVGALLVAVVSCITLGVLIGKNDCSGNTCRNNGTCVDLVNGSKCLCNTGYNGTNYGTTDYPILILRTNGSSSGFLNRNWTQYQQGFGSPTSLYWIGLDRLHQLTQQHCQARFDLQFTNGTWHFARYSNFSVGDSSTNYTLTIGGWSGDTGFDAMAHHNGREFSTYDADHDSRSEINCAGVLGGGFWFGNCGYVFVTTKTLIWYTSKTTWTLLDIVEMSLLCQ